MSNGFSCGTRFRPGNNAGNAAKILVLFTIRIGGRVTDGDWLIRIAEVAVEVFNFYLAVENCFTNIDIFSAAGIYSGGPFTITINSRYVTIGREIIPVISSQIEKTLRAFETSAFPTDRTSRFFISAIRRTTSPT